VTPSVLANCERCGEPVERIEDGGWQCTEDRRDVYAHFGLCPTEKHELWQRIYTARWNAKMEEPLDAGLVDLELPVEPVPQLL
jgi:hypothetical protein